MLSRLATGALVAATLVFARGEHAALADEPVNHPVSAAPAPSAPAPAAPPPQAQPRGAVVIAASDGAAAATKALAFDVYRDAELRPSIDDATARVLAGDAPAESAPARLKEIAELRTSIAHADSAVVARRLLASLGTELGATLVVSVALDGTRPVARVLRPGAVAFERIELGPTVEVAPDGARTFRWPGATDTFRGFLPGHEVGSRPQLPDAVPPLTPGGTPAPLAPKAETAALPAEPTESRPFYKSPWFWGSLGGAAAVGLSVFLISRATSATTDVHLSGKVGP